MALTLAALLLWSTGQADKVSVWRQRQLVSTVVAQSIAGIAHDQEAATVWDDAVRQVKASPRDEEWFDANLGIWFREYYGHDQTYILDAADQPIYAMRDGRRAAPGSYERSLTAAARPLVAQLRKAMRHPDGFRLAPAALSPGTVDLALVDGHPSIVSIKPFVSDTGKIEQITGSEYLHVSVRHLDGDFMTRLSQRYGFEGARFSTSSVPARGEAAVPIETRGGQAIGYLLWRPFQPGATVLAQIAPALVAALLLMAMIMVLLLRRIRRSTMELHMSQAHAQHLACHDPLTGLANRALFADRLEHDLARARRDVHATALLFIDLDRFKNINDSLGHPAGDELLRQFGQRLKATVRAHDTVARLGGDEFAVIQTGVRSPAESDVLCMRIVEAVSQPFDLGGHVVNIGISIGVATAPGDGLDRVELSRKADIALYQAKTSGRGRYVLFERGMDQNIRLRQDIEADLRAALGTDDQLQLHYQPLYSIREDRIIGVEALVRWQHPEKGLISPVAFIAVAEETGLIEPLGEWVLTEACTTARDWPIETISVNVAPAQLRRAGFAKRVLAILQRTGLDPHRLELEITEACFIENAAECSPNIAALRACGVRVTLDDFGVGYSSFSHIRSLNIDRVKIDRSFVSGIRSADGGSAIVQAIVDLARATGLEVTAEGVETEEQSRFLSSIGCDAMQGYLMSRPMPKQDIDKLLRPKSEGPSGKHGAAMRPYPGAGLRWRPATGI